MGVTQLQSPQTTLVVKAHLPHLTPESQFEYWTNPELLSKWWPEEAEVDPNIGGKYHLFWKNNNTWTMRGTITAFEPGERLGFTWHWDHDPQKREPLDVMVTFEPAPDGGSDVRIEHGPYSDSLNDQDMRDEYQSGWDYFISKLQGL